MIGQPGVSEPPTVKHQEARQSRTHVHGLTFDPRDNRRVQLLQSSRHGEPRAHNWVGGMKSWCWLCMMPEDAYEALIGGWSEGVGMMLVDDVVKILRRAWKTAS